MQSALRRGRRQQQPQRRQPRARVVDTTDPFAMRHQRMRGLDDTDSLSDHQVEPLVFDAAQLVDGFRRHVSDRTLHGADHGRLVHVELLRDLRVCPPLRAELGHLRVVPCLVDAAFVPASAGCPFRVVGHDLPSVTWSGFSGQAASTMCRSGSAVALSKCHVLRFTRSMTTGGRPAESVA